MTELEQLKVRVKEYELAINRIDDYFEYQHNSELDKGFVMGVLENLTSRLKSAFHK